MGWSNEYIFKALPLAGLKHEPLKICVFGDLGVKNGVSMPAIIKAAINGDFDLIVHVGKHEKQAQQPVE